MDNTSQQARIIKSSMRVFDCKLGNGETVIATAHGKLFKKNPPVVGDFVELSQNSINEYEIISVIERKNEVYRQLIREKKKKVIASNIDTLCIVMAASLPEFKRGLLDRYLLRSAQWNIPAIIIFNKMDEYQNNFDILFEVERLKFLNVECYEVSSVDENYKNKFLNLNIKDLKNFLKNKTAIFLGQSGVGKSKLISALSGGSIELISGELAKVGKGAHTTTWAELLSFPEFDLVDSPGVRTLSINDIQMEDLPELFPDLANYYGQCKFHNCAHQEGSKGCFFKELDESNKDNLILKSRLESYQRFLKEISEEEPDWEK